MNIIIEQKPGYDHMQHNTYGIFIPRSMLQEKIGQLLVGSGRQTVLFSYLDLQLNKEAKEHNNKIIECNYVDGKWKFLRVRTDKSFPNSYETATSK